MKFTIYKVENGYLLNVHSSGATKSYIFKDTERMTMLAKIDDLMGQEPENSVGMQATHS